MTRWLLRALSGAWFAAPMLALAAQDAAATAPLAFTAVELRRIQTHGPWPPPRSPDASNAQSGRPEAIALGQRLFFEPRLSPDGRLACASCHLPALAFADGRKRSTGRELLDRHAPSLWNAGLERWYGWDGAADSLWSQAIRPLLDAREMASSAGQVAAVVTADAELACRYRAVFGAAAGDDAEATLVNVAKAIAAFVGTLVSGRTPFDDFRDALARGNTKAAARYPKAAQRGLQLFIGRGQCSTCHVGPRFSNGEFADIGLPFFVAPGVVDSGRHGGIAALRASPYNLLSRWSDAPPGEAAVKTRHVEPQHRNFGEFKVPSLRNVALTAPYMHDGQLATLDAVLQHYSELDLDRLHADGEQILKPLRLSDGEHADLRAFLHSLTDPRAAAWRPPALTACAAP
jgi:cytochrome c peroxidase